MEKTDLKSAGLFRVLSHNVNGLSTADRNFGLQHFVKTMKDKEVAVFGVQETNRNFEIKSVKTEVFNTVRNMSTHSKGSVSSAPLGYRSKKQPGGTATFARNEWATRVLDRGSDSMGRWSWVTLVGKGTTKVTFISAYRVCDGASGKSIVSKTVRVQLEMMNRGRGRGTEDLRKQTVNDLLKLINKLKNNGEDVVLMIDANEAAVPGSGVERLMINGGLVDAHTIGANRSLTPPATYQRGSTKIDFVLITPRLSKAVRAATILPFCDGYISDHRALVVDFCPLEMFGDTTTKLVAPAGRRAVSTSPRAVSAYVQEMRKHFEDNDLMSRRDALETATANKTWAADDCQTLYESLDGLGEDGKGRCEHKCPAKRSGAYPWSKALGQAKDTAQYWRLRRGDGYARLANPKEKARLEKLCDIPEELQLPLPPKIIRLHWRKAWKHLAEVEKKAEQLRKEMRLEEANFMATVRSCEPESALKQILNAEQAAREYKEMDILKGPRSSGGLDRIDVPDSYAVLQPGESVPRIQLVEKEKIEEVLIPHTMQRFTQYQETPFGHGERRERLGMECDSDDFKDLLEGLYDFELDDLTEEARVWLTQLKTQEFAKGPTTFSTPLTIDEWIDGWKKMKESTASGGHHFGHYKIAALVARLPENHPDYFPELAAFYTTMHNMPLIHGFAPKRWQTCIDSVLEKIPGKPIIEKLRIISLFQADFNFMLKVVWGRRLVWFAEENKSLGHANHGSRSGMQSLDCSVEKVVVYDHCRLSRTNLITIDNDAKSCYDRILKPLAMAACIAYGLPLLAAVMHNKVHHGMSHTIRTRHGKLKPFKGTKGNDLEGTGQGSGGSPAIWLIYSVTLLAAFAKFTKGLSIMSPYDRALLVLIIAILFVDDSMLGVNDANQDTPKSLDELIVEAVACAQSWERLLFVSGGALELSKCFAYIIYWDLSEGNYRIMEPNEIPGCKAQGDSGEGPITLTYGEDKETRYSLVTESPWVGRKTLGIRTAPAGTWTDEFEHRLNQSRELALMMSISQVSKSTATRGYHHMVCPKIEFPLAATNFSQDQCDKILSPVLNASLSKMGYNRNMPRSVIFGPVTVGGAGFHDLFIEQGIRHAQMFVGHLREPSSETGKLLRIELDWCQAQAGTDHCLLTNPGVPIDYIEDCWIMGFRSFLDTYGLSLELTTTNRPKLQCENDEFLMDAFRVRGGLTASELQKLNACRMHLQVARLSDIVSGNGKLLLKNILLGNREERHHVSQARWPRQGRPVHKSWLLWKRVIQKVFSTNGSCNTLRDPLGDWLSSTNPSEWAAVASLSPQPKVYIRQEDGSYTLHCRDTDSRSTRKLFVSTQSLQSVDSVPADAVPVTLRQVPGKPRQEVYFRSKQPPDSGAPTGPAKCFSDYVDRQPPHIRKLLADCDKSEDACQALLQCLLHNRFITGGSDGGLKDFDGTFGFAWGDYQTQMIYASGSGWVPGLKHTMSSTRTELCGILAALTFVRLVMEYHAVTADQLYEKFTCTLHCDSKAAILRVESIEVDNFGTTWRCRENYDMEAAIQSCLDKLPFSVLMDWVKGHADKRKKPEKFTWAEQLNVAADDLATRARCSLEEKDSSHWPEQVVSVLGLQGRLVGRLGTELRYDCTIEDLRDYYMDRYKWDRTVYNKIDEDGFMRASSGLLPGARRRLQKLRCGWLAVNRRVAWTDPDRLPGCAECSPTHMHEETVDHIFQCPGRERRSQMLAALDDMVTQFTKWYTDEAIVHAMYTGARAWIEGHAIPTAEELELPNSEIGRLTAVAYDDQTTIGWHTFFRGFWASSWRLAQEEAYRVAPWRKDQYDTGQSWSSRTIRWFLDLFETVWHCRCKTQHGGTKEEQLLARSETADRSIRRLYDDGKNLSHIEQALFCDEMDALLAKPLADKEHWVQQVNRQLPKALRRDEKLLSKRQHAITKYLVREMARKDGSASDGR